MTHEISDQLAQVLAEIAVKNGGIIIREGNAPEVYDPESVNISGVIDSPLTWLEKRHKNIDLTKCNIVVDRDKMSIALTINESDHFANHINGSLIISPEFKKFGINNGEYITGLELSDMIRMNRSCFEDKKKAMELVTIMRNFKATITTQLEMSDDKKGNTAQLRRQTVEGSQPPSFELCIPIFKGQPKKKFTVEIDIDPDTLQATLVSPDAMDLIAETRDNLMDDVLGNIIEICPDIPIIEI